MTTVPSLWLPAWSKRLFRKNRYKVPYGGRGSSKSWTIARCLLILALEPQLLFPGKTYIRILCAREFQNSITESVHALLSQQIEKMGLSEYFIIKDTYIKSINGSEFIFKGIRNNVQSIKSMENISIVWVEEAEKVSNNSWQVLIPTIRTLGSEIWISFNPDEDTDPTYVRFVLKAKERESCDSFMVNWRDNPWFPDELRKEKDYLFRVDPEAAQHVWEGACNTRSNAVIFRGKYISEAFIPHTPGSGNWLGPYYGADWGFSQDPTVLMKLWVNERDAGGNLPPIRRLCIEKESWGLGIELNQIPDKWKRDIPEIVGYRNLQDIHKDIPPPVIRADSSRPETISHITGFGLNVIAAEKWQGSVEDGITFFKGFDKIIIHPQCEHQLEEARLYKYKVDKLTGDVLRDIVDAHNHCWDADRYALEPAIRNAAEVVFEHQEEVQISSELDESDVYSSW